MILGTGDASLDYTSAVFATERDFSQLSTEPYLSPTAVARPLGTCSKLWKLSSPSPHFNRVAIWLEAGWAELGPLGAPLVQEVHPPQV